MTSHPRAVLIDLDDTLFDHASATRRALAELRATDPALASRPLDDLERVHGGILEELHAHVLAGRRSVDEARRERFHRLLDYAGAPDAATRALDLAHAYRRAYSAAWSAVPGALDLAMAVRARRLPLVVVTNNVVAEQRQKIEFCALAPWVDALVTSEEVGAPKPDARIFIAGLRAAGVSGGEAVMVGDAWATDIEGARGAGIRPIWFNRRGDRSPDPSVTEIRTLADLMPLLD